MTANRRTWLTTVSLAVVGLISAAAGSGALEVRPDRAIRGVFGTAQQVLTGVSRGVGNTVRSVGELRRLREDYEALLRELETSQRLEGTVEALENENARLREQLDFAARTEENTVPARVVARDSATPGFSSFTINRGTRHGVAVDQPVVAYVAGRQGLVGRVEEVAGGTALVVPIYAPGSYVAVRLERSRHEGLLQGTGDTGDPLTLRYVPRDARNAIRYGDSVVTSGLRSLFPAEIPVGTVVRVTAPSWETSLLIDVAPVIDYSRLEYVFVLASSRSSGDIR
jgi:rod shape-determining protein MreC